MNKKIPYPFTHYIAILFISVSYMKDIQADNDAYLYPFSDYSAFNRPIGTGAKYSPNNYQQSMDLRSKDWIMNTKNGWSFAITTSDKTDPLVTVTIDKAYKIPRPNLPYQMHIPKGFPKSHGVPETSDGQIIIYDKTTDTVHEFYRFKWNNGKPTAKTHFTDDRNIANNPAKTENIRINPELNLITGEGHIAKSGGNTGTRASGISGLAGLIRTFEMTEPNTYPKHALAIELAYSQLSHKVQWPASMRDTGHKSNFGTINYGALVAIAPKSKGGPDLEKLGLTDAGMRIAKALVYYGAYVTDCRKNSAGIEGEQSIPLAINKDVTNDINKKLKPYLRVILNNRRNQGYSGGGIALNQDTIQ
jgi:hypothetical protein